MSHLDLNQLRTDLKATNGQIATLKQELQEADVSLKPAIQVRLDQAEQKRVEITGQVVQFLESEDPVETASSSSANTAPPAQITTNSEDVHDINDRDTVNVTIETRDSGFTSAPHTRREGTATMRVQQPKEYKKGDDFTTFSYRYKIFVATARVPKYMLANMLLNNVDNDTLQKLAPVVEKLTDGEREDLTTLLAKCHEELYPQSEVRALRQQLTAGCTKQEDEEDVDTFACRLRSIANRAAYNNISERSEACLNAFLHGVNDELYDKILATPGAEHDFEVAVSAGRKFEKMKRTRTPTAQIENQLAVFRINDSSHREGGENGHAQSRGSRDSGSNYRHNQRANAGTDSSRGHYNRTDRPTRQRTETRTCFRCRQVGHIARNCNANRDHLN